MMDVDFVDVSEDSSLSELESDGSDIDIGDSSDDDDVSMNSSDTSDEWDSSEDDEPELKANPPSWQQPTSSRSQPFEFTKQESFLRLPAERQPIDFFNLLLDKNFLQQIVDATNRNAIESLSKQSKPTTATEESHTEWRGLTVRELKMFLGLLLQMGMILHESLSGFWEENILFTSFSFSDFMSRDRFLSILNYIDFNTELVTAKKDNVSMNSSDTSDEWDSSEDDKPEYAWNTDLVSAKKDNKINYMVDYFNGKMAEVYYPGKELCIVDPSLIWRKRLYHNLDVQSRRVGSNDSGLKLYSMCEPRGFILRFHVDYRSSDISKKHKRDIMLELLDGKLDAGHSVYMTEFYTHLSLVSELFRRKTFCTGLIKRGKYIPVEVKSAKLKKKDTVCRVAGELLVGKWRDLFYVTTEFGNEIVTSTDVFGKGKQTEWPESLARHSGCMLMVDREELMTDNYPASRVPLPWNKKLFIHMIQVMLLNAFFLYDKVTKPEDKAKKRRISVRMYDFRVSVIESLLGIEKANDPGEEASTSASYSRDSGRSTV